MTLSTMGIRSRGFGSILPVISATVAKSIPVDLWMRKFDIPCRDASTTASRTAW